MILRLVHMIIILLVGFRTLWLVLCQTHLGVESFLTKLAFIREHVGVMLGLNMLPDICDHFVFEVATDSTHVQSCHRLPEDVLLEIIGALNLRVSRIQAI